MTLPTTEPFFNSASPAAPPGLQNTKPQTDNGYPVSALSFYMPLAIPPSTGNGGLAGAVKPDGTSITQDPDGTIHAVGGSGGSGSGSGQTGASFAPVVPAGAKDGSNTQYTLPAPVLANTGYFYVRNGVMQRQLGSNAEYAVQGVALTT